MTTIKFGMTLAEFHAGIASLSPETRRQFVADLVASDPAWAPYVEGIDLDSRGRGTVYTCGSYGFRTQPHDDLQACVAEFDATISPPGPGTVTTVTRTVGPCPASQKHTCRSSNSHT